MKSIIKWFTYQIDLLTITSTLHTPDYYITRIVFTIYMNIKWYYQLQYIHQIDLLTITSY